MRVQSIPGFRRGHAMVLAVFAAMSLHAADAPAQAYLTLLRRAIRIIAAIEERAVIDRRRPHGLALSSSTR